MSQLLRTCTFMFLSVSALLCLSADELSANELAPESVFWATAGPDGGGQQGVAERVADDGEPSAAQVPLVTADVTGDGALDLVAVREVPGTALQRIVVFEGRSAVIDAAFGWSSDSVGAWTRPMFDALRVASEPISLGPEIRWLEVADVDGDGDRDLILSAPNAATLVMALNDGAGRFSRQRAVPLPGPLVSWAVSDWGSRDGIDDLVVNIENASGVATWIYRSSQGVLAALPVQLESSDDIARGSRAVARRGQVAVSFSWPQGATAPVGHRQGPRGGFYAVDSSLDGGDALPGDDVCDTGGGICTLRAAVEESNATAGTQTITFAGALTISPGSGIVATTPVIIDGGTSGDVEVNGDAFPSSCALQIEGGGSTVRGLVFSGVCVELETGDGNTVVDNYFGVNADLDTTLGNAVLSVFSSDNVIGGTDALTERNYFGVGSVRIGQISSCAERNRLIGNYFGVRADGATPIDGLAAASVTVSGATSDVGGDCDANEIGGTAPGEWNVISGSLTAGITSKPVTLSGGRGTLIQGNFLGAADGGAARLAGTKESGVLVTGGVDALIGGTVAAAANTIAGNEADFLFAFGVHVMGGGSSGTRIQGNRIGTNAAGTAAISDFEHGVYIENASDVTVGGTDPGAGNVISGNDRDGVHIAQSGGSGISRNTVAGNIIGLNASATAAIPNEEDGIELTNLEGNGVDVTVTVEANIIGGNLQQGIEIDRVGITPQDILIIGNFIGTNSGGVMELGNASHGVLIDEADDNTVGGTAAGAANTIAFNGGDGVRITESGCCFDGNTVSANSIYENDGGGIGLSGGTNDGQEPPELTTVYESPAVAEGVFDSATDSETVLEFFANTVCDGSGAGEGRRYLGSAVIAMGATDFSVSIAGALAAGEVVTATSTDADGNTSFFSDCATAVTQDPIFSDGFETGNTTAWSSTTP